jgi:ribosomal protein S18 acetylase RimI-like enzyme
MTPHSDTSFRWRPMQAGDLAAVGGVAAAVHPALPEDAAVFAERLRLYPDGCHVLAPALNAGTIGGYVIAHPWQAGAAPALNSLLGTLPPSPGTFYIHDLALMPATRGRRHGDAIVARLGDHARARGFPSLSLVAVNHSAAFWQRHGFHTVAAQVILSGYGGDARFMVRTLD